MAIAYGYGQLVNEMLNEADFITGPKKQPNNFSFDIIGHSKPTISIVKHIFAHIH